MPSLRGKRQKPWNDLKGHDPRYRSTSYKRQHRHIRMINNAYAAQKSIIEGCKPSVCVGRR